MAWTTLDRISAGDGSEFLLMESAGVLLFHHERDGRTVTRPGGVEHPEPVTGRLHAFPVELDSVPSVRVVLAGVMPEKCDRVLIRFTGESVEDAPLYPDWEEEFAVRTYDGQRVWITGPLRYHTRMPITLLWKHGDEVIDEEHATVSSSRGR